MKGLATWMTLRTFVENACLFIQAGFPMKPKSTKEPNIKKHMLLDFGQRCPGWIRHGNNSSGGNFHRPAGNCTRKQPSATLIPTTCPKSIAATRSSSLTHLGFAIKVGVQNCKDVSYLEEQFAKHVSKMKKLRTSQRCPIASPKGSTCEV